jgi:hypothetical protein
MSAFAASDARGTYVLNFKESFILALKLLGFAADLFL